MPDNKPEELVARLYEQGMSDDEVREQLIEFGLSGREMHLLIKKAREIRKRVSKEQKKAEKRKPPEPPKQKPVEAPPKKPEPPKPVPKTPNKKQPDTGKPEAKPVEKKERKSMFSGLFGRKGEKGPEEKKEEPPQPLPVPEAMPAVQEPVKSEPLPEPQPPKEEKKKSGFSLFGKKENKSLQGKKEEPVGKGVEKEKPKEGKPPAIEKPAKEEKPPKVEKTKESQRPSQQSYELTMKRLALIKDEISRPVSEPKEGPPAEVSKPPKVAPKEQPEEPRAQGPRAAEPKTEEQTITSVIDSVTKKTKASITDKDKMDEQTARRLTEGMANLEKEMGEVRELLETIRQLNIKLIEIIEKR